MPKIGNLINKLQIGDKVYTQPEWWSTNHKLRKVTKNYEYLQSIKANSTLNSSYRIVDNQEKSVNEVIKEYIGKLNRAEYSELAPWNTVFQNFKTLILFHKK